jgi:predicted ester cyclase
MTRKEMEHFFARRDEAWQRHDSAALTMDHAEDGEVESPFSGKLKGHSAIEKVYEQWFSSFPDVEYATEHLLIDRNSVVQIVKMAGMQKGDFCGLAPSGRRFEVRCAFYFSFAHLRHDWSAGTARRSYSQANVLIRPGVAAERNR